ncbi:hypothetical protein MUN89_17275 [Halobacillus salinarum]|uniref:Uncharacterized protein n=1 Tax=Halobacillus salinarum TaxID=2932257 RepID=A0ABY4EID6_9BACI|nr:hypothetical protein [Halobacillus salinarum]UOQ43638.1 hypothetical protein MUN89_17275 [Halobacillus salinarum]
MMIARLLTFFIIAAALVAVVSIVAPQYLSYVWVVLCALFIVSVGYLIYVYVRKTMAMLKDKSN